MCDYSIRHLELGGRTIQAVPGIQLITAEFDSLTRGLAPIGDQYKDKHCKTACCLKHGTEVEFENNIIAGLSDVDLSRTRTYPTNVGIFRKVKTVNHHEDGLELPTGHLILLTRLIPGQKVRVLQVPVISEAQKQKNREQETAEILAAMDRVFRGSMLSQPYIEASGLRPRAPSMTTRYRVPVGTSDPRPTHRLESINN